MVPWVVVLVITTGIAVHAATGPAGAQGPAVQAVLTGRIGGTVVDSNGRPAAGEPVLLRRPGGQSPVRVVADGAGRFEFSGLLPGDYVVEVPSGPASSSHPVRLAAGAMSVDDVHLTLPFPLGTDIASVPLHRDVWVTTKDGQEIEGRIAAITSSGLTVDRPGGAAVIPIDRVRSIAKADSKANGALIGLAAGVVTGALIGKAWLCIEDCPNNSGVGLGILLGLGAGLGLGAVADASIRGREIVYTAAPGPVSVHPLVTKDARGVLVTIRW